MPLARMEIEQIEGGKWVAEVEAGGLPNAPPFRRQNATATSFAGIIAEINRLYYDAVPSEKPSDRKPPAPPAPPGPRSATSSLPPLRDSR